jgi:hypothetical protein
MTPIELFCDTVSFYNRKLREEPEILKTMAKRRGVDKWDIEQQISWIAIDLAMEIEKSTKTFKS